ncbi:MAG: DUF4926 domain-containing protein [Chloroflexi bacterium]|jgi:hypothetical protein|nr:DUF4926 domain-containing protein [Chloroflexota bacterium]
MAEQVNLFDIVALLEDLPEKNLKRGQVGTIVEELAPGVYEVEFSDNQGQTYAQQAITAAQLLVLYYQPLKVA